jgi:glyoxylase-like metal-dependent hydrolase (beta-lactamase superfamily II)
VRFEPDQSLVVQVRAGTYRLRVVARAENNSAKLGTGTRPSPWPDEEIWVFAANPELREVALSGPHRAARSLNIGETRPLDSGGDMDFRPDRILADGDVIDGDGWALEAIATPGHCANHVAFALKGTDILFAGDHVMAWSTPVVAPPDGSMSDYMASLDKLARRAETTYYPGHGAAVRDAPRFVQYFIQHRRAREAAILERLKSGASDIPSLVRDIYAGLDPRLNKAAGLSVLAHLEDLVARGRVATEGAPSVSGQYRLAST